MYDGFTLLEEFGKSSDASLLKAYLEDKGIRVILNLSHMPLGGFRMSFASHKLFVFNEDLEKALQLYKQFLEEDEVEYDHEYTDEEFEELAVNAKFEDYNPDSFETSVEMAEPEQSKNFVDSKSEDDDITEDEPYFQTGTRLTMSKDLIQAQVDQELDEDKVYKCPNCSDTFLKQVKMDGGIKFLYTMNYIFILLIILAYVGTSGKTDESFAKNFVKILPLNIGIAVYHIISISTSKYRCEDCGHVEKH